MKKVSKRVLLALLTLVLSVVTLGTTTYAWFTVGATVALEEFEMNVQSGHGLEMTYVKKEGGSEYGYVRNLPTAIIEQYIATDYGYADATAFKAGFQLDAVTSDDGTSFKKIDDDHDLVELSASDKPFLEFKLKFRTKQANSKLVWNHVSIDSTGKLWAPGVDFTNILDGNVVKDTEDTYYAKNGARVSIESGSIIEVFELPEETGSNAVLSNNTPNWTQGAHDYYYKVTNYDLSTKHSAYTAAKTITTVSAVDLMNFGALTGGYYYADVTVRVYIEGFDSETFNAILSDNLKVALSFTLAEI